MSNLKKPLTLEYVVYNVLHTDKSEAISLLNELIEIGTIEKNNDTYRVKTNGK
jgi:predicted transcriptional regulator